MKKLLVVLLSLAMVLGLTGCSKNKEEGNISPVKGDGVSVQLYKGRYVDLFEDDVKARLQNLVVGGIDETLLSFAGTEFPKLTFKSYDGKEVKLPEGKTIFFEIVSPWCHFCQDMTKNKVVDKVMENFKDVEYYQYFGSATENDVKSFYEATESEIPAGLNVLIGNEEFDNWLSINEFYSIPMVMVINSEGKVGLSHIGLSEPETFNELVALTMNEMNKPLKGMEKNFYEYMKDQRAALDYIDDLEEITVPKEYFK